MDPATLSALVASAVTAITTYLGKAMVEKVADKALEKVGEEAGAATARAGGRVLTRVREWFSRTGDRAGARALEVLEQDPQDPDYRAKLAKELARVIREYPSLHPDLEALARDAALSVGQQTVAIHNSGVNTGAQGVFNAPVHIGGGSSKP